MAGRRGKQSRFAFVLQRVSRRRHYRLHSATQSTRNRAPEAATSAADSPASPWAAPSPLCSRHRSPQPPRQGHVAPSMRRHSGWYRTQPGTPCMRPQGIVRHPERSNRQSAASCARDRWPANPHRSPWPPRPEAPETPAPDMTPPARCSQHRRPATHPGTRSTRYRV